MTSETVLVSTLGDGCEDGHEDGNDWVLKDENPCLPICGNSLAGAIARLLLHQLHWSKEYIPALVGLRGEESAQ